MKFKASEIRPFYSGTLEEIKNQAFEGNCYKSPEPVVPELPATTKPDESTVNSSLLKKRLFENVPS